LLGCRVGEKDPPAAVEPPPAPGELRAFAFRATDPLEFEYVDLRARFRTAIGAGAVPFASRQVVRVTPPTFDRGPSGDDGVVHVVDLTQPDERGAYTTQLVRRLDFEARALAALPPGAASRQAQPTSTEAPGPIARHDQVIVYGTSWCGACKDARTLLEELHVAAVFVNVETDPNGARDLAARAARVGAVADRVPVIDVHGHLLVGFEPNRLRALLGDRL
jgi:glutaredoxin